ncbi:hypothetical protein EZV62_009650 [Acer yangbiense]|uniref:Integrase catalytic domain-containing protein n=1 Tax=Acer yangbiense TaxID=1000413 RepID=A0A5C7I1V7_9ROSI|nr:hypothetical protein EZV62_009650 [Acer yangbiense]
MGNFYAGHIYTWRVENNSTANRANAQNNTQANYAVLPQLPNKLKCLQADLGTEFKHLIPFLKQNGITFRTSCAYTHQQNGVPERKHRHVVETGLTLLAQAQMPLTFWVEAFQAAMLLINNLPTPILKLKSPYEVLYHRQPNYNFFKVFGCSAFPYLRPYSSQKFNFHTSKRIFIGYSLAQKGYKCLHQSCRIYVSRNVVFNEFEFPYKILFPKPVSSTSHTSHASFPTAILFNAPQPLVVGPDSQPSSVEHGSQSLENTAPIIKRKLSLSSPVDQQQLITPLFSVLAGKLRIG